MIIKKELIRFNHPWSAQSAMELANKQAEKERQIQTQLNELQNKHQL